MNKNKRKGFTLIELIAVLVILAILALIVTPLVMNIIRKARISADRRSIDAYGRSVELAIANYLLDNGDFPTEVSQLTIEYSGDEVVCSTTQLKSDSSIYLAGCTVGGRSVNGYTYGKEETVIYDSYEVGDEVTYNNINYYVIKDSDTSESTVTLLKAEPLSYSEIQMYGSGTGAYTSNSNGYGGMQYHSSSNLYEGSYIKNTVDSWASVYAPDVIEVRLITKDELISLGYELPPDATAERYKPSERTPSWVYNSDYNYWTMSPYADSLSNVYSVYYNSWGGSGVYEDGVSLSSSNVVRPVIIIKKSAF